MATTTKKAAQMKWLGLILAVLLIAVVLVADPMGWFKPSEAQREQAEGTSKTLCSLSLNEVTAFEIKPAGDTAFKLFKDAQSGKWLVDIGGGKRYQADQERLNTMLDKVPGLRAEGLATSKADKYAQFEVDDAQAIGLKIFTTGDKLAAALLVGKSDGGQGCFVRLEGDPAVYRASQNLKSLVAFSAADYRSRKPWGFSPAAATSITVRPPTAGAAPLTFTKNNNIWQTADGKNGNQNLINETLKKLSEVSINEYVDTPDEAVVKLAGLEPGIIVKAGVDEYKFTLGAVENSQAYVKDQDGNVYKASEYSLKFYSELNLSQLTFDDTKKTEAAPGTEKVDVPPAGIMPPVGGATPPAGGSKPPATGQPAPPKAPPAGGGK